MCINCGENIGCLLDNKTIEKFIPIFVTNMVLQNICLSWIIQSNQKINFYIHPQCPSCILNLPWYNTTICSRLNGFYLKIMLQLPDETNMTGSRLRCPLRFHYLVHSDNNSYFLE